MAQGKCRVKPNGDSGNRLKRWRDKPMTKNRFNFSGVTMLIQNQNPEQHARDQVDRCLSQAGWTVQDNKQIDLLVSLGVAVREYQTHVGNALCSLEEECIIEKLIEQRLSQSDVLISEAGIQLQKTEVLRQSILKQSLLREAGCTRPQGRTCLCPIRTHEDRKNQTSINKRIN